MKNVERKKLGDPPCLSPPGVGDFFIAGGKNVKWSELSEMARTLIEKCGFFYPCHPSPVRAQTRERGPPLACASIIVSSLFLYNSLTFLRLLLNLGC
jgi:hypothetical protein